MDKPAGTPDAGRLSLEDEDVEDLFASPSDSGTTGTQKPTPTSQTSSAQKRHSSRSRQQEADARDARLRAELERVREVNTTISGVIASLTKAGENMETVNGTVSNASTLLATWTRILSLTEFNQRLVLDSQWQGATRDVEEAESEDARRQLEAERRVVEEQRRREEGLRRAEEEERRRAEVAAAPGRGGGKTRGTRGAGRGYGGVGGQAGRGRGTTGTSTRGGSAAGGGLGRTNSTRGRAR